MSDFFKYFPTVEYGDYGIVRDITKRVTIEGGSLLPYTMDDGIRPDILSDQYYSDPDYDWLIYYANEIIDPREFSVLDPSQFQEMIVDRYGSVEDAQRRIKHWRHNWRSDPDSVILTATYEGYSPEVKQLYNPVRDFRGTITGYTRKRSEFFRNTNVLVNVQVASDAFGVGDLVELRTGSTVNATAEVHSIGPLFVLLKDVQGTIAGTSLVKVATGQSIAAEIISTYDVIKPVEAAYYEPVSFYEYESEKNESKRFIKMVSKSQAPTLLEQLKEQFD